MSAETVRVLVPEIALIAVAVLIYVGGALVDARKQWSWIAAGGILAAAVALWTQDPGAAAGGQVATDPLAYYARWLALAFGGLLVLSSSRPLDTPGTARYVGSLLLAIVGLMLVSGAGGLVLLFVGLELISIPICILLYLGRGDAASRESATKYFFLSILASAMLLYGFGFLYGVTGSTDLDPTSPDGIPARLAGPGGLAAGFGALAKVALVLIFAALGFKIAAVPFHSCTADVCRKTTYTNAALLSLVPKAAGLVALVRIGAATLPGPPDPEACTWRIALVLAMLTMTVGNLMALWQDNLRRLMAYSSIAQGGYMLIGLSVALAPAAGPVNWDGVGALLFYLCAYAVATIGTFAALDYLGSRGGEVQAVDELAGLGRARPLVAAAVAVFMFSLAGIPPLAGFWGKLGVIFGALGVQAGGEGSPGGWFLALAVVGVLNAVVAAAYYLRIVAAMYFRTPLAVPKAQGGTAAWFVVMACALLCILIGILPGPLLGESNKASPLARQNLARYRMPPPQPAPGPEVAAGLSSSLLAVIQDSGDSILSPRGRIARIIHELIVTRSVSEARPTTSLAYASGYYDTLRPQIPSL